MLHQDQVVYHVIIQMEFVILQKPHVLLEKMELDVLWMKLTVGVDLKK